MRRNHTATVVAIAEQTCFPPHMKRFALIALSLALAACKSDKSGVASSDSKPRISAEDHAKLIHEKLELEKDLGLLVADHNSDGLAEIEAIKDRLNEGYISLRKVQSEHPILKPLTIELSDWDFRARKARKDGNSDSEKAASAEILKINQKLEELSKEQPEIIEARKQIDQINKELHKARREVAREIPGAQHLVEALDTIEKQLTEMTQ